MKKYLFLINFCIGIYIYAQVYQPIDTTDYKKRKEFLEVYKAKNTVFLKSLRKHYEGKTGRELEKSFKELQLSIEENIQDKGYVFNGDFQSYIKNSINQLAAANTDIPSDFTILVAKDNYPNAYSIGDGTLVINTGLFTVMDNDNQFLSILSHEIAHQKLEHSIKTLLDKLENDRNKKQEISTIKASSFNKTDRAFQLVKNMLYSNVKKMRLHEISADSLGYQYLKKAGIQNFAVISSLKKLKQFDDSPEPKIPQSVYKQVFNIPNQAFKEEWLKKEDFSQYNYQLYHSKISEDSLKSHPDIAYRIELLQKNNPELRPEGAPQKGSASFVKLSEIAQSQIIPNFYETEKYGLGIYACLIKLEKMPNDALARLYLGKLFQKIYDARKSYTLNRYLDKIEPKKQSESYQQFLSFIWNLNLDEIKNIADYYQKSGG